MAIAIDSHNTSSLGPQTSSPATVSVTNTAGNFLVVGIRISNTSGSTNTITYAGVSMTRLINQVNTDGASQIELWYLANPATGTNNLVINFNNTGGANVRPFFASYSGVGDIESAGVTSGTTASASNFSKSVTTEANNNWLVGVGNSENVALSGGTGTTVRNDPSTDNATIVDSNGALSPTGSYSLQITGGTGDYALIVVALNPAVLSSFLMMS